MPEQELTVGQAITCIRLATDPDGYRFVSEYGIEKALYLLGLRPEDRAAFLTSVDVAHVDIRALARAVAAARR